MADEHAQPGVSGRPSGRQPQANLTAASAKRADTTGVEAEAHQINFAKVQRLHTGSNERRSPDAHQSLSRRQSHRHSQRLDKRSLAGRFAPQSQLAVPAAHPGAIHHRATTVTRPLRPSSKREPKHALAVHHSQTAESAPLAN